MGLLSDEKKAAFEEHLRTCTMCQQEIQVQGVMDQVLSDRFDPGNIETFIVSKVRLIKNMKPENSWLYIFQVGAYVAAATTLLWIFIPFINNLITMGRVEIWKLIETYPSLPGGFSTAVFIGFAIIFILGSGILTYRVLRD